ncbi:hypothetical protein ILUMI_27255 [Ignelater luminosus]|uniref:Uncharacterized protein n=1 Tax=Ignelater luminosus TaxID=2038154 RepID=A0A8K0C3L6_IGNLU|nr:hypothetical protein ILUMI_27255 [Ignelater luminosus]
MAVIDWKHFPDLLRKGCVEERSIERVGGMEVAMIMNEEVENFEQEKAENVINKLKNKNAAGPDEITAKLLNFGGQKLRLRSTLHANNGVTEEIWTLSSKTEDSSRVCKRRALRGILEPIRMVENEDKG